MDFASSGLETPWATCWRRVLLVYFRGASTFRLSLLVCLLVLDRADWALLRRPSLLFEVTRRASRRDLVAMILGDTLFLWEGFALFSLRVPVPQHRLRQAEHGSASARPPEARNLVYADSLTRDPVTLALIALAMVASASGKDGRSRSIAIGIALYLSYVAWIGGDFMADVSSPCRSSGPSLCWPSIPSRPASPCSCAPPRSPSVWPCPLRRYSVRPVTARSAGSETANEHRDRGQTRFSLSLDRPLERPIGYVEALSPLGEGGESNPPEREDPGRTRVDRPGGLFCRARRLYHRPGRPCAALLARLQLAPSGTWRIGHFWRPIPEGYLETLATGENKIDDRHRAILRPFATRHLGPLSSPERLVQVVRLVTGVDRAPDGVRESSCRVPLTALNREISFSSTGMKISSAASTMPGTPDSSWTTNDSYRVSSSTGRDLSKQPGARPTETPSQIDIMNYDVSVPDQAICEGFDRSSLSVRRRGYSAIGGVLPLELMGCLVIRTDPVRIAMRTRSHRSLEETGGPCAQDRSSPAFVLRRRPRAGPPGASRTPVERPVQDADRHGTTSEPVRILDRGSNACYSYIKGWSATKGPTTRTHVMNMATNAEKSVPPPTRGGHAWIGAVISRLDDDGDNIILTIGILYRLLLTCSRRCRRMTSAGRSGDRGLSWERLVRHDRGE